MAFRGYEQLDGTLAGGTAVGELIVAAPLRRAAVSTRGTLRWWNEQNMAIAARLPTWTWHLDLAFARRRTTGTKRTRHR